MKKKALASIMAAIMCVGVVACGSENVSGGNDATETADEGDKKAEDSASDSEKYANTMDYFKDHEAYQVSENPEISMDEAMDKIAINGQVIEAPVTFEKLQEIGFVFFNMEKEGDSLSYTVADVNNKDAEVEINENGLVSFYACSGNQDSICVNCDYVKAYEDVCFPAKTKVGDLVITSINYSGSNCSVAGGFKTGDTVQLTDVQEKYTPYRNRFLGYSEAKDEKTFFSKPIVRSAQVFILEGNSADDPDIYMINSDSYCYSEDGKSIQFGIGSDGNFISVIWDFYDNLASTQMSAEYGSGFRVEDPEFEFYRDLDLPAISVEEFYDGINTGKYACSYDQKHRALIVFENGEMVGKISIFAVPNYAQLQKNDCTVDELLQLTYSLVFCDGKLAGRNPENVVLKEGDGSRREESVPVYAEGDKATVTFSVEGSSTNGDIPVATDLDEYGMGSYWLNSTDTPGLYEIYTDCVEVEGDPVLVAYYKTDETEVCEISMAEITKEEYVYSEDTRWTWEISNGLAKAYNVMGDGHDVAMVYQCK